MSGECRPSPEALLRRLKRVEQEDKLGRGTLKIILGSAAGVGKTYHMLEEAQSLRKDCVDVVAAVVETHGRPETEALLEGLEVIPRRHFEHGGVTLKELDLDKSGTISAQELDILHNKVIKLSLGDKLMEVLSTHPNMLKRIKRLSEWQHV